MYTFFYQTWMDKKKNKKICISKDVNIDTNIETKARYVISYFFCHIYEGVFLSLWKLKKGNSLSVCFAFQELIPLEWLSYLIVGVVCWCCSCIWRLYIYYLEVHGEIIYQEIGYNYEK